MNKQYRDPWYRHISRCAIPWSTAHTYGPVLLPIIYQLITLDTVQRRAIQIVDHPILTRGLESLAFVEAQDLSVFSRTCTMGSALRNFLKLCPHHRFKLTPLVLVVTTGRFCRTFSLRTLDLWNRLLSTVFPQAYDMRLFKKGFKYGFHGQQRDCSVIGNKQAVCLFAALYRKNIFLVISDSTGVHSFLLVFFTTQLPFQIPGVIN